MRRSKLRQFKPEHTGTLSHRLTVKDRLDEIDRRVMLARCSGAAVEDRELS